MGAVGVTLLDGTDGSLDPVAVVAVTVNVCAVSFTKPVTVQLFAPEVVQINPPGFDVTVYPVIREPLVLAGALHETFACPFPALALTPTGAPGTGADGVTVFEGVEGALVPVDVVAVTVNVCGVSLTKPLTVQLVAPVVVQVNPPGLDVTE